MPPDKIIDYLALVGDSADNIPGVEGVGPKTAVKLINEYGDVENIYDSLDEIKNIKLRERLSKNKTNAFLSKELVALDLEVPIEFNLDEMEINNFDFSSYLSPWISLSVKSHSIFLAFKLLLLYKNSINEPNSIEYWNWDYGNGITETNAIGFNEYTYSQIGEYEVSLTVTNIYGQEGDSHIETIIIGNILTGDMNEDTILNVLDIVILANLAISLDPPTSLELNVGDLNGDGILNVLDIVILVNLILR